MTNHGGRVDVVDKTSASVDVRPTFHQARASEAERLPDGSPAQMALRGELQLLYSSPVPTSLAWIGEGARRMEVAHIERCAGRSLSSSVRQIGREFSERPPRCRWVC